MNIQYQDQQICVFESALYRTTSCLFANEDLVLLVDPNWLPREVDFIRQKLELQLDDRPFYLLFTHSDYDHILAYEAFPEAQVICSEAFTLNPDKAATLAKIREFDEEYYIQRHYPIRYPEGNWVIQATSESRLIGNTRLHFYQAPGHTSDGLFTYIEPAGILIVGDYLSNIEFPFIYDHSQSYLQTLDLAEQLFQKHPVRLLITGHGDHCTTSEEMQRRVQESKAYITELQQSLSGQQSFELKRWLKRYDFAGALKACHEENVEQLKKEKRGGRGKKDS